MDPSKLYVEYYAKLHAERAMRLWPLRLDKSERPDFISKKLELGLEVTRAAIEEWAQQEADMNRVFGSEMPGDAAEQAILADCDSDAIANGDEFPLFELPLDVKEMHIGRVIERISDKTKMLKEYRLCRENWLYVFSETTGIDRDDMLRVQLFVDEQEQQLRFDRVLVKVGCLLYVLQRGEELTHVELSSRTMMRMHRQARRLSVLEVQQQRWFTLLRRG